MVVEGDITLAKVQELFRGFPGVPSPMVVLLLWLLAGTTSERAEK